METRKMRKMEIKTNLTFKEWKELLNLAKKHFKDPEKKIIYSAWKD